MSLQDAPQLPAVSTVHRQREAIQGFLREKEEPRFWSRFDRTHGGFIISGSGGVSHTEAQMAELVDALGSGPSASNGVEVRVLFWAPSVLPADVQLAIRERCS